MKCACNSGENFDSAVVCVDSCDKAARWIKAHYDAFQRGLRFKYHRRRSQCIVRANHAAERPPQAKIGKEAGTRQHQVGHHINNYV